MEQRVSNCIPDNFTLNIACKREFMKVERGLDASKRNCSGIQSSA